MSLSHATVVILAGGEGTRFAPVSTADRPKQFLPILHPTQSMIEQTYQRASALVDPSRILISTNQRYEALVRQHLPHLPQENIIAEPLKKNTAPPIAFITSLIQKRDPKALLLFLPSDHFIEKTNLAIQLFEKAFEFASRNKVLLTFGVPPTFPSTHYGYIQVDSQDRGDFSKVRSFTEKPPLEKAKEFLGAGNYFWNSGMFLWGAEAFMEELKTYQPELFSLCSSCQDRTDFFQRSPNVSIDYGLMEKSKKVVVCPFDAGWSDVGTWEGLKDLRVKFGIKSGENVEAYLKNN